MSKILLIDDDTNLRETIEEFLLYQQFEVVCASNGQEALDALDNWTPDVILCDILMPIMDGPTFHDIIKNNTLLSAIPFIFLSAKKEENLMRKCFLQGADDFLSKPFQINDLLKIIEVKSERFKKIKNSYPNLFIGQRNILVREVNTPLNGILGFVDVLLEKEEYFTQNDSHEFLKAIKSSSVRLNRTLQNIFLYQNVIANDFYFNQNEHCSISLLIPKVLGDLESLHIGSMKRIKLNLKKGTLAVDKQNLIFILFEVIDNALKFSNGRSIQVLGSKYNDEFYEIIIKDQGIGFTENELSLIAAGKQFHRDKQEQQGLGLGLYLSRYIVKKLKGLFSITSEKDIGTIIKIYLPTYEKKYRNKLELIKNTAI
jgi:two-component system sensor kinase